MGFLSDPSNPTDTIGGRELSLPSGPRDQRSLMARDDVLTFQSEVLEQPMTVVGAVSAALYIDSDAPDTDLSVRLVDIYPDGRAMLVLDGIQRARAREGNTENDQSFMTPGRTYRLEVDLGATAQVFDRGHRIGVMISSSNHRRFKVGGNTDLPFWEEGEGQVAQNRLFVDEVFSSHLLLPTPRRGATRKVAVEAAKAPNRALTPQETRDQLSTQAGAHLLSLLHGTIEAQFQGE